MGCRTYLKTHPKIVAASLVANTAIDKLRTTAYKHASEHTSLEDNPGAGNITSTITPTDAPTDQKVIRKEMSECVREYFDRLSPDYRTVLILKELEGFKNKEIAYILQITLENLEVRLHRTRASLKKELDDSCDFYHNEEGNLACDCKPILMESKKPDYKWYHNHT